MLKYKWTLKKGDSFQILTTFGFQIYIHTHNSDFSLSSYAVHVLGNLFLAAFFLYLHFFLTPFISHTIKDKLAEKKLVYR